MPPRRSPAIGKRALAALVATAFGASALGAEPPPVEVGTRVRITSVDPAVERIVGTVAALEADAVVVRRDGADATARIATAQISRLDVSAGRRSRAGRGAVVGAAVGVMPGLLVSVGDYDSDVHGDDPSPAAVAAVGAAGGALLGALVGWAMKSEEWKPLEKPVAAAIAPLPNGGVAFSLRVAWGGRRSPRDVHRFRAPATAGSGSGTSGNGPPRARPSP